jgi:sulfonate transport system permease protein
MWFKKNPVGKVLLGLWVPVVVVVLWWAVSRNSTALFFPPLTTILTRFQQLWLFKDTESQMAPSVLHLLEGFAIASIAGIAIGVLLWMLPRVQQFLLPLFNFFRALPAPALIPGLIALLGLGAQMSVAVIVIGCIWPVLLSTMDGLAGTDRQFKETAQAYQLSRGRTIWSVMLRSASPQIAAGLRAALQAAVVLMVVSEMVGATSGIGYFILVSQQTYATADMWSGMIALGIVGTILNLCFLGLERGALKWFHGARAAERAS